jgi:hypothetical protein
MNTTMDTKGFKILDHTLSPVTPQRFSQGELLKYEGLRTAR